MIRCLHPPAIGVDLGTANTVIVTSGRGIVLDEPSLVCVKSSTREVESVGSDAEAAMGRTPERCYTARPLRCGEIADPDLCASMLRRFIARIPALTRFRRMRAAVAVPGETSYVQKTAIAESLGHPADLLFVDQALAAARGAGLPLEEPVGRMVVDIGAGSTKIAILFMASVVSARTFAVGGEAMDHAIAAKVRAANNLLIGERTSERLKLHTGSALPLARRLVLEVKGRCLLRGIPRVLEVCDCQVREALEPQVQSIIAGVRRVLEDAPPELSADMLQTGIVLTGGSALLRNLDRRLSSELGLPVRVADAPMESVALGLGSQLQQMTRRDWRRLRDRI